MIFIGGISQGREVLNYVKTAIRDRYGGYGQYEVFMTYMYFSFFFIPLLKWNRRFYVKMFCCDAVYELNQEASKALPHDRQVDITQPGPTLVQEGSRRSIYKDGVYRVWEKCVRRGYETEGNFGYCPKCEGRLQGRQMVHTPKGQVTCSRSC